MIFKDYYKILGLDTSRVSLDEIKVAYRNSAKKYHPDVNVGDVLAEERIKDINEAYRVLSTPSSKRKYDRTWNAYSYRKQSKLKADKESIMNIFFGSKEKSKEVKVNKTKEHPLKGENVETRISISLYEAFYGSEKKISLKTVNGNMKNYTIMVPKGIREGEKIRLIGQGKAGKNGGKNGDLLIQIHIDEDKKFKLHGYDIYTDLLLSPWEAALGARVDVQAIDGETKVYIPQGVKSSELIRIPNKGYYNTNGTRGDLVAEIKVMVPDRLTDEEKNLYKKMKEISKFNPRNNDLHK